jgi:hypothetical protein
MYLVSWEIRRDGEKEEDRSHPSLQSMNGGRFLNSNVVYLCLLKEQESDIVSQPGDLYMAAVRHFISKSLRSLGSSSICFIPKST